MKLFENDSFDVVLLDLGLPDSVSLDGLVQIRGQKTRLPIIVLTGLSDEDLAVKAIALGAQDYLVKGKFDADSLYRAIHYSIERQRLEAERRKLTDAVPALISHIDANYRYIFGNRTYEQWFGLNQEHIVGKHVREVLGETVWQKLRPYMELALSGEQVFHEDEFFYQHGGSRWVNVSYTPDRDERGQVRGFIVLAQDISLSKRAEKERELSVEFLRLTNESRNKKDMIRAAVAGYLAIALAKFCAEEELQKSEDQYKRLVKLAPIPLCFATKNGEIIYINDRFTQVFGYTHDDLPTIKEWWQSAYPDAQYRRWVVETWESAARRVSGTNTDIESIEYNVTCKDGTVRVVEISGITIDDNLLVTFIDITERKRAEEARREGEEKFSKSFYGAPIMMAISKIEDGTYIDVNDKFLEWADSVGKRL